MGLGPLEQFLEDSTVSEVMINGSDNIYVERHGIIERTNARFLSEEHLRRVIERIVSSVGRRIDESSPMVDARLADGSRVNVIVPPLSLDGSILTIRKFAKDPFTVKRSRSRWARFTDSRGCAARSLRGRRHEPARLGRHRNRQDHVAQRAVELRAASGPHRHDRGRCRAATTPATRHPSRGPAREHRGQRRRSPSAISCATHCACDLTGSSSARFAAPRRSTCCRR